MNPTTPDTQNVKPARQGRRRRVFLSSAMLLLAGLTAAGWFLSSPSGQRWLAGHALGWAMKALEGDDTVTAVDIEAASIHLFPPAIELHHIRILGAEAEGAPQELLSVGKLTLLPEDATGLHWNTLGASGVRLTQEGWQWIHALSSATEGGGSEAAWAFRADALLLEDVTCAFPASTGTLSPKSLTLDKVSFSGLRWDGALPAWSSMEGSIRLATTETVQLLEDTTTITLSGGPDTLGIGVQTDPAFWLGAFEQDHPGTEWVPGLWEAALVPGDSTMQLKGLTEWGQLEFTLGLDETGVWLDAFKLGWDRPMPGMADWLHGPGQFSAEGPIHYEDTRSDSEQPWAEPLSGLLNLEFTGAMQDGSHSAFALQWDLKSGAMDTQGSLSRHADSSLPFSAEWSLGGRFVPIQALSNVMSFPPVELEGDWSWVLPGDAPGSGRTQGRASLKARPSPSGIAQLELTTTARTAPLRLSETLELYGSWTASAACTLDDQGTPSKWWSHLNLDQGRFIPLEGFQGNAGRGAPIAFRRMALQSRGDADRFELDLASDIADLNLTGPLSMDAWTEPVQQVLFSSGLMIDRRETGVQNPTDAAYGDWDLTLRVWRGDILERYSGETWSLGAGSVVAVRHAAGEVQLDAHADQFHYEALRAENIAVSGSGGRFPLHWDLTLDSLTHRSAGGASKVELSGAVDLERVSHLHARWDGPLGGDIRMDHELVDGEQHVLTPTAFDLRFEDMFWQLDPTESARLDWTGNDFSSMRARSFSLKGTQGVIGLHEPDSAIHPGAALELRMDRFPAGPWMGLASRLGKLDLPEGEGLLHGWAALNLEQQHAAGEIQWEDARMDGIALGDLCATGQWLGEGTWNGTLQQLLDDEEVLLAQIQGVESAELILNRWPLAPWQPLLIETGLSMQGHLNGRLAMNWEEEKSPPEVLGSLFILAPHFGIEATGMDYSVQGTFDFQPGYIGMDMGEVLDPAGGKAFLNTSIQHENFSNWSWDFGLDLPNDFQVMDLDPDPSRLYHGQVFATGSTNVFGTPDFLEIEATAQTSPGTRFTMPIDALEGPELPHGIRFTGGQPSASAADGPAEPTEDAMGFSLDLEVGVTSDAQLSMVLDQLAGERVDGRATGSLSLSRAHNQDLSMQGGLEIVEGNYRFSLRDLFSKNISVAPGSRIEWDGDPYEAQLEILAVAPMKVNPYNLNLSLFEGLDAHQTDVEVGVGISGAVSSPQLEFSIGFPTLERSYPEVLSRINSILSTPEETERQAFALLAVGQFIPPEQQDFNLFRQAAASQASDLLSTGVSELINSLSKDIEFGMRYSPASTNGTEASNPASSGTPEESRDDYFEVDVGLRLMNDRLRISGTLGASGMQNYSEANTSDNLFMGGFDIRYQLTSDGRWELIGFRKPESHLDYQVRQGIGALYQVRFSHLSDLFHRQDKGK